MSARLTAILRRRTLGGFRVPVERMVPAVCPTDWVVDLGHGVDLRRIDPEDRELRVRAAHHMIENFYREAPVPTALQMYKKSSKCHHTNSFLQREMADHLDSGASVVLISRHDGGIVGVLLNRVWARNASYDVIDPSVREWHDSAAELAALDDPCSCHLTWRRYQVEHIYNLGQHLLASRSPPVNNVLFCSMMVVDKEYRSSRAMAVRVVVELWRHWNTSSGYLSFWQTNFRLSNTIFDVNEETLESDFKEVVDNIEYKDEKLVVNGKRAFEVIDHLGGITFFATKNEALPERSHR